MKRYYLTFGVQYASTPHPHIPAHFANPDAVIEIHAASLDDAVEVAQQVVGRAYSSVYPWDTGPPEKYYPLGVVGLMRRQSDGTVSLQSPPLASAPWVVSSPDGIPRLRDIR